MSPFERTCCTFLANYSPILTSARKPLLPLAELEGIGQPVSAAAKTGACADFFEVASNDAVAFPGRLPETSASSELALN